LSTKFINKQQIRDALESANTNESRRKFRESISPKAQLTLSVDASPLFTPKYDLGKTNVLNNIKRLRIIAQNITYSTQVSWLFLSYLSSPNILNTEKA
jgi:hypothetical protein